MKTINKLFNLVLAAGLVAGLAACTEKAPEYEWADPATTQEVFFPDGLPSTIDLKTAGGSITVPVSRVNTASSLDVTLNVSADKIFSIPASVSFPSGQKSAEIEISYDVEDLVAEQVYPVSITIASETSEYGVSSYEFNGTVPAAWTLFATGTLTESPGWWGETEPNKKLYYQEVTPDLWYCRIPDCFGYETIKGGDTYDVQDYLFYWDKKTNYLYVCSHWMGYTASSGYQYYYGTNADYYMGHYYNVGQITTSPYDYGTEDWFYYQDKYLNQVYGEARPHYDGNGGFYLADCYIYNQIIDNGAKEGYGAIWDDAPDTFICDGFVRTTDYNALTYKNIYSVDVVAESLNGEEFSTMLATSESDTTLFYVKDYFGTGSGLAFVVPEDQWDDELGHVADNAEIVAGDNEQYTGVDMWGKELVVNIGKKSYVEWPEDAEYPVYHVNVDLSLYSYEVEDGKRVNYVEDYKLGTFSDVITVTGGAWYTIDDVTGVGKVWLDGSFYCFADDFFENERLYWEITMEDGGVDEDGTSWVIFNKFAPYNATLIPDNRVYVEWYNGFLYFPMTEFEGPLTYQGEEYPLYYRPFSAEQGGKVYDNSYLLFGYYYDDVEEFLVSVDYPYNSDPVDGLYLYADGFGGITAFSHFQLYWNESSSAVKYNKNFSVSDKYAVRMLQVTSKPNKVKKAANINSTAKVAAPKASVSSASSRTINTSNAVKIERSEKNFSEAAAKSIR